MTSTNPVTLIIANTHLDAALTAQRLNTGPAWIYPNGDLPSYHITRIIAVDGWQSAKWPHTWLHDLPQLEWEYAIHPDTTNYSPFLNPDAPYTPRHARKRTLWQRILRIHPR